MADRPPEVEALWRQTTDWNGDIAELRTLVDSITELFNEGEDMPMVDMTCSNLLIWCPAKERVPLLYTTHLQVMLARAMLADEEDVDLEGVEEWCDEASASLETLIERFDEIYGEGEGALRMAGLSEEIDGVRSELNDAKDEAKRESSSSSGDEDVQDKPKHANAPEFSNVKPTESAAQISDLKDLHLNTDKPVVSDPAQSSEPGSINSQNP